MEWQDQGIVLGARRHGETSVILEVMTEKHGRHLGLVRGGRSRRLAPVLQPGNAVGLVWRARIEEHLGHFSVEGLSLRAAGWLDNAPALYALSVLAGHLRLLPERDPHRALYEAASIVIDHLDAADLCAALLVRFEVALLEELGFGMQLDACAATGATQELIYVSPKTGRAVSRAAGSPYRDRLLALPPFLNGRAVEGDPSKAELAAGFGLTGHFLLRHVLEPRALVMPEARAAFVAAVLKR